MTVTFFPVAGRLVCETAPRPLSVGLRGPNRPLLFPVSQKMNVVAFKGFQPNSSSLLIDQRFLLQAVPKGFNRRVLYGVQMMYSNILAIFFGADL